MHTCSSKSFDIAALLYHDSCFALLTFAGLNPAGAPAYDVGEIIQSGSVYVLLQINRAWHFSVMVLNVHWDLGDVFALVYSCVLWSVE